MIKKTFVLTFILCVIWICSSVHAATNVYYSIIPDVALPDKKVACNISIAGGAGVATFSVAQTGNIGVGCHVISSGIDGFISVMTNSTTATIVTALGVAHGNVTSEALTSIKHEYASLGAAEASITDASHINNASFVAADVVCNLACYYDDAGADADTSNAVIDWSGTTDATRFLSIYTPEGGTESINNQRPGDGIYDESFYYIHNNDSTTLGVSVRESFVRFDGIQFKITSAGSSTRRGIAFNTIDASSGYFVDDCIFKGNNSGTGVITGIRCDDANNVVTVRNTIVYALDNGTASAARCLIISSAGGTMSAFNCTFYDSYYGFRDEGGTSLIKNSAIFGCDDDLNLVDTITNCATFQGAGEGTNGQTLDDTTNYSNEFTDITTGDFSLVNGGVCEENGTDTSGDGVTDDIIGTARPQQTNYDIGAFECSICAAVGSSIQSLLLKHIIR